MPSCEKCWSYAKIRSHEDPTKLHSEHYMELIAERVDTPCTPEQQAGHDATECVDCKRMTVHQYAKLCTVCGIKKEA